jgi:hypothetical protein
VIAGLFYKEARQMCPLIDTGDTCVVARIAREFGNTDDEWLGATGMVSEVMRPFFLLELPDGRWTVRFEEELEKINDRRDFDDAPAEAGASDPGEVCPDAGTGGEPGASPDAPGESVLGNPLADSDF